MAELQNVSGYQDFSSLKLF